jgi:membrane protease YdiL (CAAX protease family)
MVSIATIAVLPAILIGTIGLDVGQQIFGETDFTPLAMGTFPTNKWSVFFMLLGGAGIAEESSFRLVRLSLFWKLTKKRKFSILLSALFFGAYHITPLNGMYQIFLQYPISQFMGSAFIGIVWGYLFVKRGYETTVLSHTLSDWLPFMIFSTV